MKRDFELKKIKSILNNIIDNSSLKVGLNNVKIQSVWKKMMGSNINSYTSDISLKKRTLYVKLSSSVLREELSYGKGKIIKILNEEFGEVIIDKIVLR
ncbi:MAG: RNA-binding protein [Flavobacteriaceae bacterium]|nr:RNA-binding protein [Flavobacteriaceae bacterium]